MRYAIISDIHSNFHALEACLEKISNLNVDSIVCLGDIVGYNAMPSECVESIRQKSDHCVLGNHDESIQVNRFLGMLLWSRDARDGLKYSIKTLSDEDKEWLAKLPVSKVLSDNNMSCLIIHSSPVVLEYGDRFPYILNEYDAKIVLNDMVLNSIHNKNHVKIMFFGHSHAPTFVRGKVSKGHKISKVNFSIDMNRLALHKSNVGTISAPTFQISDVEKENTYYLFNPGSIGQSRGRNPVSFIIFDSDEMTVTYHTFDYDVKGAQDAIRKAGYSKNLIDRLDQRI